MMFLSVQLNCKFQLLTHTTVHMIDVIICVLCVHVQFKNVAFDMYSAKFSLPTRVDYFYISCSYAFRRWFQ